MTTKTYSQLTRAVELCRAYDGDDLAIALAAHSGAVEDAVGAAEVAATATYDVDRVDALTRLSEEFMQATLFGSGYLASIGLNPHELFAEVLRAEQAGEFPDLKPIVARQLGYIKRAGKNLDQQIERAQAQREKREARELQTDLPLPEPAPIPAPPPKRRGFFGALVGVFR